MKTDKTAVLLMNLGGPDSLSAIEPFLYNLFSDKEIIRFPLSFILQKFIAKKIAKSRAKKVLPRYKAIGGASPISEITSKQALALQTRLNSERGGFIVEPVMRYWKPYTKDVVERLAKEGYTDIIALTLYPHYSSASTGSSVNELKRVLNTAGADFRVRYIDRYPTDEGYINALCKRIKDGLSKFEDADGVHILFSAHSLPAELVEKGDLYVNDVKATIKEVLKKVDIKNYRLAFQSRSGPVKWLEPATDATIVRLADEGVKDILVVPVSFVSDHIETLYEIDIMFKELAQSLGVRNFIRTESFNDSPDFIDVLKDLILHSVSKGER